MLREQLQQYVGEVGGLLKGLLAVQAERGFLPPSIEAAAADVFNVSRAEVKGVISFYADLRMEPAKKVTLRVCEAEACQAVGGRELKARVCQSLGIGATGSAAGDDIEVEPVYCLGLCSVGPAVQVNDNLLGRADELSVANLVAEALGKDP